MMDEEKRMKKGKVYLIGAGPGDPELFTLKGKRCLEKRMLLSGIIWRINGFFVLLIRMRNTSM